MVAEMFNIVGFHIPKLLANKFQKVIEKKLEVRSSNRSIGHDHLLYSRLRCEEDLIKHESFSRENIDFFVIFHNFIDLHMIFKI